MQNTTRTPESSPAFMPHVVPHALDRPALLAALRARLAGLERAGEANAPARAVPLSPPIDAALPGRAGLPRAALHEIQAVGADAAAGFAALLLARSGGTVFWIARHAAAPPPGLACLGLPLSRLLLVRADRPTDALWAMEEALRCPAVSGALLREPPGERLDDVAARRLRLAAETGGGIGLLLRDDDAPPGPAPVATRWRVSGRGGTGASRRGLGDPQWRLELLRGPGRPGAWNVTWHAASESLVPDGAAEPEEAERASA